MRRRKPGAAGPPSLPQLAARSAARAAALRAAGEDAVRSEDAASRGGGAGGGAAGGVLSRGPREGCRRRLPQQTLLLSDPGPRAWHVGICQANASVPKVCNAVPMHAQLFDLALAGLALARTVNSEGPHPAGAQQRLIPASARAERTHDGTATCIGTHVAGLPAAEDVDVDVVSLPDVNKAE